MLKERFQGHFEFCSKYFDTLIEKKPDKFPQSIVFEGLDILGQYIFALELSRILNCKKNMNADCDCINCNWTRQNKHPAVITISQTDFRPHDDKTKNTNITVEQTRQITKDLMQSSDYHRVFIFTGVKHEKYDKNFLNDLEKYRALGLDFKLPDEDWTPIGLTKEIFDDEAPNSLLKVIEEPPKNTTFIFLTKNSQDLISTIVSRSMVFRLPSDKITRDIKGIEEIFEKYPKIDLAEAYQISEKIQSYIKENEITPIAFLSDAEQYFGELLKANPESEKIKKDILMIKTAANFINASMSPKTVFEYFAIKLID